MSAPSIRKGLAALLGVDVETYRAWEAGRAQAPRVLLPTLKFILGANQALAKAAVERKRRGEDEVKELPPGFKRAATWYISQVDDQSAAV